MGTLVQGRREQGKASILSCPTISFNNSEVSRGLTQRKCREWHGMGLGWAGSKQSGVKQSDHVIITLQIIN